MEGAVAEAAHPGAGCRRDRDGTRNLRGGSSSHHSFGVTFAVDAGAVGHAAVVLPNPKAGIRRSRARRYAGVSTAFRNVTGTRTSPSRCFGEPRYATKPMVARNDRPSYRRYLRALPSLLWPRRSNKGKDRPWRRRWRAGDVLQMIENGDRSLGVATDHVIQRFGIGFGRTIRPAPASSPRFSRIRSARGGAYGDGRCRLADDRARSR